MGDVLLQVDTGNSEQKISRLEQEFKKLETRIETLTQALGKEYLANQKLSDSFSTASAGLSTFHARQQTLLTDILETTRAIAANTVATNTNTAANSRATREINVLTAAHKTLHQTARGAAGALGGLWLTYGQSLAPMVTAFAAVTASVNVFKRGMEFEWLTTFASSLSDGAASAKDVHKALIDIKDVGQTPTQLAKGFLELQKAGFSVKDSLDSIVTVSKYAAVAQLELGQATEQLVTITTAFEKTSKGAAGGMLTVADTADIVAYAAQKSTASFTDMQTAFRYMVGTASTAGFSIQEVASALMVMANHGLKGSLGATSLRTAFERLINPTHKAAELFKAAGGNLESIYSDGQFKGIQSIGKELERLKNTISAKSWSEFSLTTFGMRGMNINALVSDMAELDKQLANIGNSVGFVETTFGTLQKTTKMAMIELEASFDRAFIKAFEGEKATGVINDINNTISSSGFATSLEHLMTGTWGLGKAIAAIAESFYKLPTWVAEVGLVSALLFGAKGKAALGGLLLLSGAIDNISWAMENNVSIVTKNAEELKAYRENFKKLGPEFAESADRIGELKAQLADWGLKASSRGVTTQIAVVEKLREELARLEEQQARTAFEKSSSGVVDNKALKTLSDYHDKREVLEEQAFLDDIKRAQDKDKKDIKLIDDKEEARKKAAKNSHAKLMNLTAELEAFNANSEDKTLAKKLEDILKYENSQELLIKNSIATEEEKSKTLVELYKKTNSQRQQLGQGQAAKELKLEQDLNSEIGLSDDVKLARKIDKYDAEYEARVKTIDEIYAVTKDEFAREENMDKAFTLLAIQTSDARFQARMKEVEALRKFTDTLSEMEALVSMNGMSELDKELLEIKKKTEEANALLQATGKTGPELKEYQNRIAAVREEMERIAKAKLGNNIWDGFIAGVKDAQDEMLTLGKIGSQMAGVITSELGSTFKEIFTGENENPYADKITTIADKIKSMQYDSLEGGVAQLEWLNKEYDASLAGAMAGNEEMFDQYMSNVDDLLAKSKEELSPEEYAKVYAKTMDDLNKLNDDYADKTESTWDRIADSFGDMADRILDKFLDLAAQMVAQDLMNSVFVGSGSSGTSWTGAATSAVGSAIGTGVSEAWDWASSVDWGSFYADGGYMGDHPQGGVIRAGSGTKDDVFLGYTGNTANYGMGGEFIINKKATSKYLPLLEEINTRGFAEGGYAGFTGGRDTGAAAMISNIAATAVTNALTKGFTAATVGILGPLAAPVSFLTAEFFNLKAALLAFTDDMFGVATGFGLTAESYAEALQGYVDLQNDIVGISLTNIDLTEDSLAALMASLTTGIDTTLGYFSDIDMALAEMAADAAIASADLSDLGLSFGLTNETVNAATTSVDAFAATLDDSTPQINTAFEGVTLGSVDLGFALSNLEDATNSVAAGIVGTMQGLADSWAEAEAGWAVAEAQMASDHEAAQRDLGESINGIIGGLVDGVAGMFGGSDSSSDSSSGSGTGTTGSADSEGSGFNGEGPDSSGWSNGGLTKNYAMGGEYIVNKKATAANLPLLNSINFADGGRIEELQSIKNPNYWEASELAKLLEAEYKGSAVERVKPEVNLEDSVDDIAAIVNEAIDTTLMSTMDSLTKEIYSLNRSYEEQVEKLTDLEASESDFAVLEAARITELSVMEKEAEESRLNAINDIVDAAKYLTETSGMDDLEKAIFDLNKSYDEQGESLKELSASTEDYASLYAAKTIELEKLEEGRLDSIDNAMESINETLATDALTDYEKELRSINETYAESISALQALGASESQLGAARLAQSLAVAHLEVSEAETGVSSAETALRAAYAAEATKISDTFSSLESSLNSSISSSDTMANAANSRLEEISSALEKMAQADFLQRDKFFSNRDSLTGKYQTGKLTSADLEAIISGTQEIKEEYYATAADYKRDFYGMAVMLDTMEGQAVSAVAQAEQHHSYYVSALSSAQTTRDAQLKANEEALNAVLGIEEEVPLSIEAATAAYILAQHKLSAAELDVSSLQLEAANYTNSLLTWTNALLADTVSYFGTMIEAAAASNAIIEAVVLGPSSTSSSAASNDALLAEITMMRQELAAANLAIAANTAKTAKQLSRWDGDGMPDVRV